MAADTIYVLDTHVEPVIAEFCEHWGKELPMVVIAKGWRARVGGKAMRSFRGATETDARVRIIMDPIDGTRGLMYDKRSAWFLAVRPQGCRNTVERHRGGGTGGTADVEADAGRSALGRPGAGAQGVREEVRGSVFQKLHDLALRFHGAEHRSRLCDDLQLFSGTKVLASRVMERIVETCLGETGHGKGVVFDDPYISTGGQLYELMMGMIG